jgi:transcriptional regulator with XRE-family HTH domain
MKKHAQPNLLAIRLGEAIRQLRTLKKLSQENMAEMLKVTLRTYGLIERGENDYAISRISEIAQALGVSEDHIFNHKDYISNFFDQCQSPNVNAGATTVSGNISGNNNHYDTRELIHQIEQLKLKNELLQAKLEKAEVERKNVELEFERWRVKYE